MDEIRRGIRPVLVVEENPEHGLLIQIGFQEAGVTNPVIVLMNADTAIAYLAGDPPYADRRRHPLPALLLVAIKDTKTAGVTVLEWFAEQRALLSVPVVAVLPEKAQNLHKRAYKLGAGMCLVKPAANLELVARIRTWARFWLGGQAQEQADIA